jgi:hypothetical protein
MEPLERAIVVAGEATVRRVPDVAVVSLSVTIRDRKVDAARDKANARASAILERLGELGIADADVQAPSVVVQPTYDYSRGTPKPTGYEAARPMTVRVREVDRLGPLLDAVVDDGATQVHGTHLDLADAEAAGREALAMAYAVARDRARALGQAAGVTLGEALRIEEDAGARPLPVREMGMLRAAAADSAPTEVALGEVEISARVRVWFELG